MRINDKWCEVESQMRTSHGLWDALSQLELASSPKIAEMLKPFVKSITDCYECGVEVPTLPCKRETTKDIRVAALFLKRLLNDLRATWNLLLLGYTSQAGSVAAAAFENALAISCVAGSIDRAEQFLKSKTGLPWSVAKLCRMQTSQTKEAENYWKVLYSQYEWLCKVKHSTVPSALHDAFSVSLTGSEFIVMAAPDTRKEDLPSKAFILSITILKVTEAIERFALARELDIASQNVVMWQKRIDSIPINLDAAVDPIMIKPLPFTYDGRMLQKDKKENEEI